MNGYIMLLNIKLNVIELMKLLQDKCFEEIVHFF